MSFINNKYGLALLVGISCVFGFAPFGIFPIPVLALAVLFALWQREGNVADVGQRGESPRTAAWLGFCFGMGLFSAGIGWIYIAMYEYGDMPLLLALLASLLFAAFWALLPALAGYIQARFIVASWLRYLLVMPAVWALFEWFRGLLVTGFPWLVLGYAHSDSPLAGYAPLLGVFGVSLVAAVSAGLLVLIWQSVRRNKHLDKRGKWALTALLLLWGAGALLRTIAWTQPHGEPFTVALIQGNIAQNLKFDEDALVGTLETYRRLVSQNEARLTVLPETALPIRRNELPENYVQRLRDHARQNGGDLLIGAFERENGQDYNSVFTLGASGEQHYRKHHLVPFGEFIPLRPMLGWLINGMLNIPMGDLARGGAQQIPLNVAGQRVAVNICYEDVFGEEIIRSLPHATLLVNVTNDAWYGNSPVASQHNQIAQLRALETGRMMLRATNTGVTSIIGADGKVLQQLPQHVEAVLQGQAQGYDGSTPYVRWGNAAVLLLVVLMLAGARVMARR